jgi:hypothetical protein
MWACLCVRACAQVAPRHAEPGPVHSLRLDLHHPVTATVHTRHVTSRLWCGMRATWWCARRGWVGWGGVSRAGQGGDGRWCGRPWVCLLEAAAGVASLWWCVIGWSVGLCFVVTMSACEHRETGVGGPGGGLKALTVVIARALRGGLRTLYQGEQQSTICGIGWRGHRRGIVLVGKLT